ncbi:hypothetical protein OAH18_01665 [bacterium]|nr:hypothetical protein [bacterium]
MKLDGALFAIERRTMGGCIDLGIAFFREHMATLVGLTSVFAVPCCALVCWLAMTTEDGLYYSLLTFVAVSPLLGAALAAGCGQRVFGDSLTVGGCLAKSWSRFFTLVGYAIVVRVGGFILVWVLVLPALLLANRYGFIAELLYLEQLPGKRISKRISALTKSYFTNLLGRMVGIGFFYVIVVIALFTIADTVGTLLLGTPIMFTRATGTGVERFEEMMDLFWTDSLIITVLHAVMWLAYPICRLAWLFCYLDLRIRREGWDIDLDCRIEARRLEAAVG